MKFITSLFAFIVASAIYTKVSAVDDVDLAYINCQNELEKYAECLTKPKIYTFEQSCPKVQSERCQQFYNDPLKYVTTCKEDFITIRLLHPIIMNYINQFNLLACQKDETGNPCPFSEPTINEFSKLYDPMTDEELKKAKENTCKSKICREVTYKAYANIRAAKEYYDEKITLGHIKENEVAQKEEIAKYLDSEECKAMSNSDVKQENTINNDAKQGNNMNSDTKQDNTSDEDKKSSSDATTLKAVNGIFITLCLLLLTLY